MIDLDLRSCELCPRLCRVNREEKPGACGCSARLFAARAALHFGEEPCISGVEGSGTVFFSGCNLHCVFCQNHKISRERYGKALTATRLADIFRELEEKGANNINLVTPTPWVTEIIKALELYRPTVPVLYNTSGYERVEVLRELEGLVDVWLPDYKYADSALAARFSSAADYPAVARAALREMYRQSGNLTLNKEGKAVRGVMIRHLVLPLHLRAVCEPHVSIHTLCKDALSGTEPCADRTGESAGRGILFATRLPERLYSGGGQQGQPLPAGL